MTITLLLIEHLRYDADGPLEATLINIPDYKIRTVDLSRTLYMENYREGGKKEGNDKTSQPYFDDKRRQYLFTENKEEIVICSGSKLISFNIRHLNWIIHENQEVIQYAKLIPNTSFIALVSNEILSIRDLNRNGLLLFREYGDRTFTTKETNLFKIRNRRQIEITQNYLNLNSPLIQQSNPIRARTTL